MKQAHIYDDTIQNFQVGDEVLIIPDAYETEYGACFCTGTTGKVKTVSAPDCTCSRYAYLVQSDERCFSQFYLASELKKVGE